MTDVVLDAWAVLALLQGEDPAAGRVREVVEQAQARALVAHLSWMNLGEVFYILGRARGLEAARQTLAELRLLPLRLHDAGAARVQAAAELKATHRLSYADAFAVALARELDLSLLTGDPEILSLPEGTVATERLLRYR